jgi:glycerophosphoryl diester phosphodiesterase
MRPLFATLKRPLYFAHRGCSFRAPENTMPAFRLAEKNGIAGIELDIQLSGDGEIMVFHDESLERICGIGGTLADFSAAELRQLDAGSWKENRFAGTPVPRLSEVLDELGGRMIFDIEIKGYRPAETRPLLIALAALIESSGCAPSLCLSSFDPRIVRQCAAILPEIASGLIYDERSLPFWLPAAAAARYARADFLKPRHSLREGLTAAKRPVIFWTVDDPTLAAECLTAGAEGIISNRPEDLQPS